MNRRTAAESTAAITAVLSSIMVNTAQRILFPQLERNEVIGHTKGGWPIERPIYSYRIGMLEDGRPTRILNVGDAINTDTMAWALRQGLFRSVLIETRRGTDVYYKLTAKGLRFYEEEIGDCAHDDNFALRA